MATSEDEETKPVQVDTTKVTTGTVRVMGKGWRNPTPTLLARVTKGMRYFAVGLITMVSGSDLFTGGQAKIVNFCLGVFILLLGGIDLAVGVEPDKQPYSAPNDHEINK